MQNMGFLGPITPPKKSLILQLIVQLISKTRHFLVGHNPIPVKIVSSAPSKLTFVFLGRPIVYVKFLKFLPDSSVPLSTQKDFYILNW